MEMQKKDEVIHKVNAAIELLAAARNTAVETNPLAASVPEFANLLEINKELGSIMRAVSKMNL